MGRTRRVHPIRTEAIFMTDTPIYFPFACGCAREVSGFRRVASLPFRLTRCRTCSSSHAAAAIVIRPDLFSGCGFAA